MSVSAPPRVLCKDVFVEVVFNYVCGCWIGAEVYVQTLSPLLWSWLWCLL